MLKQPPIGIKPKYIHDEQRFYELKLAIRRFLDASVEIPLEWINEYNDLIDEIKKVGD